ncbi:MAG: hypothetical protein ABIP90_04295 [Vicinamibacterales bacterium]
MLDARAPRHFEHVSTSAPQYLTTMLKGTRTAVIHRIQPTSIHGQVSLDVFWTDPEDPEGEIRHARVGNESTPPHMAAGDTVTLHYLMGMVTEITA